MMPVLFGNRIAKPLMGLFMSDDGLLFPFSIDQIFGIEDCTGIFHSTKLCFGLHVGQFPVGIRPDMTMEIIQYVQGYSVVMETVIPVLRINPTLHRNIIHLPNVLDGKPGNAHDHHFDRDVNLFVPVREFALRVNPTFFCLNTIGDDGIMKGGDNNKINACLIAGMIHHRQPMMAAVRPIISEKSAITELGSPDDQTIPGYALVVNDKSKLVMGLGSGG